MTKEQIEHLCKQEWFTKFCTNTFSQDWFGRFVLVMSGQRSAAMLIVKSFEWATSPEGEEYWNKIDDEWQRYVRSTLDPR